MFYLICIHFYNTNRFRPVAVKAIIHDVLHEELSGKQYNSEEATSWSKHISDTVKEKLKGKLNILPGKVKEHYYIYSASTSSWSELTFKAKR